MTVLCYVFARHLVEAFLTDETAFSLSRQGIIFIPALFVLETAAGMSGIVWAQPVADVLSLVLAAMLYFRIWRKPFNLNT